jgi:photosystem II stability/assembly factor-like uncharacterized protein
MNGGSTTARANRIWTRDIRVKFVRSPWRLTWILLGESGILALLVGLGIFQMWDRGRSAVLWLSPISPDSSVIEKFHWARSVEFMLPLAMLCVLFLWSGIAVGLTKRRRAALTGLSRSVVVAACLAQPVVLLATLAWGYVAFHRDNFLFSFLFSPVAGRVLLLYPTWVEYLLWPIAVLLILGSDYLVAVVRRRVLWSTVGALAVTGVFVAVSWLPINALSWQFSWAVPESPLVAFWSGQLVPTGWSATGVGIACAPDGSCLVLAKNDAVHFGPRLTTYRWSSAAIGNGRWTRGGDLDYQFPIRVGAITDESPDSMGCASSSVCLAVGASFAIDNVSPILWRTSNGGTSWSLTPLPPTTRDPLATPFPGVRCDGPRCLITDGNQVFESSDAGSVWRLSVVVPIPAGYSHHRVIAPTIESADCFDADGCVLVGGNSTSAVVFHSDDGGRSWTHEPAPPGLGGLEAVRCSGGSCHALGAPRGSSKRVLFDTEDGGLKWENLGDVPDVVFPTAFACSSSSSCVVLGTKTFDGNAVGMITEDNGSHWQTLRVFSDQQTYPEGIACSTSTTCTALGSDPDKGAVISSTGDGGTSWREQRYPRMAH